MATKYIPPDTVPQHITILNSKPLSSAQALSHLAKFLQPLSNSDEPQNHLATHLSADVTYQLTELHQNLQWIIDNKVAEQHPLKCLGTAEDTEGWQVATSGNSLTVQSPGVKASTPNKNATSSTETPKKKKEKKKGSKWAA